MKNKYFTSFLLLVFGLFFNTIIAQSTAYISSNSGSYSVIEGSTYSFKVNLYNVSTTPVIVDVSTTTGTAESSDYNFTPVTVTIPAGQLSSSTVTISTTNDNTIEQNELLNINVAVTSGNTTHATVSYSLTIIDNDKVPTLSSVSSYPVNENGGSAKISFSLSNPYNSDVVIHFFTTNGTAGSSDFTAVNTTNTIVAGQTSTIVNIPINNDSLAESDETATLTANVTSGNTTNSSLVTIVKIIDDDTMPTLTISEDTISEGGYASLYARLDRIYNSNVTIQFTTNSGTAGTSDYTTTNITSTISAGNTYVGFSIPTTDDTLDEPNESFTVIGTVTSGNTTNVSASATVTIVDNDGLPDLLIYSNNPNTNTGAVAVGSSSLEEGQNANFAIGLTQASTVPTIVQITTQNGTAGSLDYTPQTTTVTIPAGTTYYSDPSLFVPTILDQLQESTETFIINAVVTSGNTYNTSASQTMSILDNYNLNAQTENVNSVAEVGVAFPLLANDTLHGLPLNYSDVTISLGPNTIGATVDAQGILTIPSTAPMGYYYISYTICEVANTSNCDTVSIIVQVVSPLEVTYTVSYSDYNTDGFVSAGDVINYQFNIKNNGNAPITNIVNTNAYNITINGGPIANLNAGQTDATTFIAIHILTQNDINFGYKPSLLETTFKGTYHGHDVEGWVQQIVTFSLPISDGIKVVAFIDANSNGVKDGSEIDFPLGHFNYEINNNGVNHNLYTNSFYLYESNPTTTYNLTYAVDSQYAANNTCTTSYTNVTVALGSGVTTYYFPITITPYQDLSINLVSYSSPPRPGFYHYNYILFKNNSNQTVPSGTVTFTKDSALDIVNISEPSATITATGFTYNFTNLLPYQTRYIGLTMSVPTIPTVSLGQLVTNSATITLPIGDVLPLNNTSSTTQTIIGSWDPNDIMENHGEKILHSSFTSKDYLTYTIRFENTGTANAINIKVQDVLDSKLDPATIKMVNASASYSLERVGDLLTWKFNGIDLPPSIVETNTGKGYITFQVKPKAGYAISDIIPSRANIYFDFNPAIATNIWNTEFTSTLAANQFENGEFLLYPNPTKNKINIALKNNSYTIDAVIVNDILGKTVFTKNINNQNAEIDLSNLSNGVYFVKVKANGNEKIVKLIKE